MNQKKWKCVKFGHCSIPGSSISLSNNIFHVEIFSNINFLEVQFTPLGIASVKEINNLHQHLQVNSVFKLHINFIFLFCNLSCF